MEKNIVLAISSMRGGGAERVLIMLANHFSLKGYQVTLLVTNQRSEQFVGYDINKNVQIVALEDQIKNKKKTLIDKGYSIMIRCLCKMFEFFHISLPESLVLASFNLLYKEHRKVLEDYLKQHSIQYIIAFLQPTIQLVTLHHADTEAKIIISERLDPKRLFQSRYGSFFVKKYYSYVEQAVFQSESARKQYPLEIQEKSIVIANPLREGLPEPWSGVRQKKIVNFCRLTRQKNLMLLLKAFELYHKTYPEYKLEIYGEASTLEEKEVKKELLQYAAEHGLQDHFEILPFQKEIHKQIINYAMYVSSSDYEGMSNSMLEAMAIGLPSICTDCPAGGARAIIDNHVNGILVPVGDVEKMYLSMAEIAGNPILAEELSKNGQKLREELSLEKIAGLWEKILI